MGSDVGAPRASTPRGLAARLKMFLPLIFCFLAICSAQNQEAEESELLEGSESQNYGYGYGTKVDGPHGSSTVYVHGFGTDDSYHPGPAHHGYGGVHNGYGYNQVHGYNGYHGPRHGAHHGHHDGHLGHHGFAGYGAPTPFVGNGFRYGFGHGFGHIGHSSFAPL